MTDIIQPPSDKNRFQWKTAAALGTATWLVTAQLSGCAEDASQGGGDHDPALSQSLTGGEGEGTGGEGEGLGGEGEGTGGEGEGSGGEGEGTGGEGEGAGGEGEGAGGEGEGSGGEGEGAATAGAALATDDVAYLTQLGLIRGHLAVGHALYSNDLAELAETHMKHPRAEIYAAVEPAFAVRGCSGFAAGLTSLTGAVVGRADTNEVNGVYDDLVGAIRTCEQTAAMNDPVVVSKVIEDLLRTAAVEYQIGIIDGQINNLHEYQDAWGFTRVALAWAKSPAFASNERATAVAAQIQSIIADLQPLWPSLNPESGVSGEAAQLYGAAARVQVASLALQR